MEIYHWLVCHSKSDNLITFYRLLADGFITDTITKIYK